MKKLLLIVALPLLLSACKQPEPPASVTRPPAEDGALQAEARAGLPEGIRLDVPYTVVSDEWTEEEGTRKRRTVIEFEQADVAGIVRQIQGSMAAADYRFTGSSEIRGGERINFRGDPGLRVTILVRPRGAVELKNSASTGNIEFSYRALPAQPAADGQGDN